MGKCLLNNLTKSSLDCEEDKHLEAMVMVIILQDELPIRKRKDMGILSEEY